MQGISSQGHDDPAANEHIRRVVSFGLIVGTYGGMDRGPESSSPETIEPVSSDDDDESLALSSSSMGRLASNRVLEPEQLSMSG